MVTRGCLLVVALVALGSAIASAKGPPLIAPASRRFDHDRHAASARTAGKPVDCAGCHDERPKAEHARCSSCHVFPSSCSVMQTPGAGGPARLCRTCHLATRPECLPTDLPPLPAARTLPSRFTHAAHMATGTSITRDCGICHPAQAEPAAGKPHVLCSGCHNPNGAKPTMAECATCHRAPVARTAPVADAYRLAGFDHRAHASAANLIACLSCHDTPVGDAPRPSMLGCQTRCHDGKKAFSATGTHCTMCHKGSAPAPATRSEVGFSHTEHTKRGVKIDACATCHMIDSDGILAVPLSRKDHLPCANPSCHQSDFVARAPRTCGICHDAAAPWARTAARAGKRLGLEWVEVMNHASHLGGAGKATCESCHGDKRTGGEAPRDHRVCASCHAHGPAPAMTACAGCHRARSAAPAGSPWSVAATFEHTRHAVDPRSHKPTACSACHTQVAAARDIAQVSPPRMADCDGCHDGKVAFKTTGFGCARCHGTKPATARAASGDERPAAQATVSPVSTARAASPALASSRRAVIAEGGP